MTALLEYFTKLLMVESALAKTRLAGLFAMALGTASSLVSWKYILYQHVSHTL